MAISHAVPDAVAERAFAMASIAETSVIAGTAGAGKSSVPSRPDSPSHVSAYIWKLYLAVP